MEKSNSSRNLKRYWLLLTIIFLCCINQGLNPPEDIPAHRNDEKESNRSTPAIHEKSQNVPGIFYSHLIKDNFVIYVSLPAGYDPDSPNRYHVIYVLDGDYVMDNIEKIVSKLSSKGYMPKAILVGIGYPDTDKRGRDFLTLSAGESTPGGANNFYNFLQHELIPYVDTHYNTTPERTVMGHSAGGYFAMYALFQYRPFHLLFTNFIACSSPNNFHDGYLYMRETLMRNTLNNDGLLPLTLYMAVGSLEEERFLKGFDDMTEWLNKRHYNGFTFKSVQYLGLDHEHVFYPAVEDALVWIFSDYQCMAKSGSP